MASAHPLVLASASPRRVELLRQIGVADIIVKASDIEETPLAGELPRPYCLRLAAAKAQAVQPDFPDHFIIAADTVVACGRRILPKAETAAEVKSCLALLSGRRHRVHGGLAVIGPTGTLRVRHVETIVAFKRLELREIDRYVDCGEGIGKAGGYAIQGRAAAFISFMAGSYSNVVGLPLYDVSQLLNGLGFGNDAASD